jgi:hypothetical protein
VFAKEKIIRGDGASSVGFANVVDVDAAASMSLRAWPADWQSPDNASNSTSGEPAPSSWRSIGWWELRRRVAEGGFGMPVSSPPKISRANGFGSVGLRTVNEISDGFGEGLSDAGFGFSLC